MTQEQKDLLIKDLCARLPYGVKVKLGDNPNIFDLEYRIKFAAMYGDSDKLEDILDITNIKPYLFPLSSMTREQGGVRPILAYSIGELIEMLPMELKDVGINTTLVIQFEHNLPTIEYIGLFGVEYSIVENELVDALYKMIIKLKEEEII